MITVDIMNEYDIVQARHVARDLADEINFSIVDKTRIATTVSELARNIYCHAGGGRMEMEKINNDSRIGIRLVFIDEGKGIPDIEQALQDGFSTGNGLGQGLPGSKRLMDEFDIESKVGKGTRVMVIKWK